ncbi:MAG TPA: SIS domain-containing protein [Candidatus Baltobacteraceae bacterium]|jgi:D-sedoheptulose 7-phosphate isomerase|nr:SIS domain-containing protein [Candidatus Baltobacteraceae bacterium]
MLAREQSLHQEIAERILARNAPTRQFFATQAVALAHACAKMSEHFLHGGRLMTAGKGPYATDAMHVSVEFIHPVLVGKRALPAIDISLAPEAWISALATPDDMIAVFDAPQPSAESGAIIDLAKQRGAMTLALPGCIGDYAVPAASEDEHIHQEIFELLGHCMYESVHVFLEHEGRPAAQPATQADFLYPFLTAASSSATLTQDVARSINAKVEIAVGLREVLARTQPPKVAQAADAIARRLRQGARILAFGNGGSATDATDFVLDCVMPVRDCPAIPAISLALEPAVITATANDVGSDLIFQRQLIAQSKPVDVALAFSTSGGSRNVVTALEEAHKRGLLTIAILGYDGGEILKRGLADYAIVVDCDDIPRIQEAQGTIYHVLREIIPRC